ncbi:MAG: RHS repeat-associated core domain-containing protein, partial [Chloroflexia bacterium]
AGIGLYFYNARWYDPALGRFAQPDTVMPKPSDPQQLNRFSYVLNNPLRYNDPSGHVQAGGATSDDAYLQSIPKRPSGRYLCTEQHGCFDTYHLNTGRPGEIIKKVRTAIAEGGGMVPVGQIIHMGPFTSAFWGEYIISDEAAPEQAVGIALGIYEDWSIRFEAWEGSFPGPIGDDTSFAIEDLPSHYVGFYAATTGVSPDAVFWNHLGGIEGTNQTPARSVKNSEMTPKVPVGGNSWVNVPWPDAIAIAPVPMGSNTWWPAYVGCAPCWGSSPPNSRDINALKPR